MISVLVTGKDSQLSQCIADCEKDYPELEFTYKNSKDLDITDIKSVKKTLQKNEFDYCINCAAYTAVDRAETETETASKVNTIGVKNLANICKENNTVLIHISTDFVFDGEKKAPYLETDKPNPINVYGATKLEGEIEIARVFENYFIIRTSWLYSEYNSNFLKTILRLANNRKEIDVVDNQTGSPTYATDLASFIIHIISSKSKNYGVYNYSNSGETTWYNFASEIALLWNLELKINPINSKDYKTEATRPNYSVLNTTKLQTNFNLKISSWNDSLQRCFFNYK